MLCMSPSVSESVVQSEAHTNVVVDSDDQIHPAGRHVPQTSGEPSQGIPAWIEADPNGSLDNTDVVLWHTFGLTHFPTPEDYPVMPAEPMTVSPIHSPP